MGIYFGHKIEELEQLNWEKKIEKLENLLKQWKKRYLSVFGKITVLKSIALPVITYTASMITTPKYIIKRLNK